jgi:hypothetical protein
LRYSTFKISSRAATGSFQSHRERNFQSRCDWKFLAAALEVPVTP